MAQSAAALPLLVAMTSDFHEHYDGRMLVGITRPTRREAEEDAYRTYMHDTVDAAYTLLGILMGSAHARPPPAFPPAYTSMGLAGDTGTATESCGHGTAATESCGHACTGTATDS